MKKKEVIFLLPYLHVNTTSAERFKSFIKAFQNKPNITVKVFLVDYNLSRSYFRGLDNSTFENENEIETFKFHLKPNFIQRIGFFSVNNNFKFLWRIFQLLHLIVYKTDIFCPYGLEKVVKAEAVDGYVIASGSHFSYFSIANLITKKINYKLVLDYRDPWTFGYPSIDGLKFIHQLKVKFNRAQEINLLSHACIISTVSKALINQFPLAYQNKIALVPNGSNYKAEDVNPITNTDSFNIVFAGTIYNDQLIDHVFFEAFSEFVNRKNQQNIKLQFIGSFENHNLIKMISLYNLIDHVEVTKRISKVELLKYLNNASGFLHLKYGDKKDIISSKQAEYLMFRRPILLPVSDEGDLQESILSNNAGYVCYNKDDILKSLELLWDKFLDKENLFIEQPSEFIENLSREKIAEKFVKQILEFES
jgi:hypothetical protein